MASNNQDEIIKVVVEQCNGKVINEIKDKHMKSPVADHVNGNTCCGCGLVKWNEELKRIRVGIVEMDIVPKYGDDKKDEKKDLVLPLTDFIVCTACFQRSYLTSLGQVQKNLRSMLGLEYLTPLG